MRELKLKIKLFLHIGPGKTGSSSIQNALFLRAPELLDQGVFVPSILQSNKEHHLLAQLVNLAGSGCLVSMKKLKDSIAAIREEANNVKAKKIVISSDLFANSLPKGLLLLYEELIFNEFEPVVIAYKRNLHRLALSTFQQQIKNGKHLSNFYLHKPFTYFHMTKSYADVFGLDNFIFRDYKADDIKSWSVVEDFFESVIGVNVEPIVYPWINQSISSKKLQLINFINYYLPYPAKEDNLRISEIFRWAIHNISNSGASKLTLSENEAKSITEFFLHDEELFSSFLPAITPYLDPNFILVPEEILGPSFEETICKAPDRDVLAEIFGTLGCTTNDKGLLLEAGVLRPTATWKRAE